MNKSLKKVTLLLKSFPRAIIQQILNVTYEVNDTDFMISSLKLFCRREKILNYQILISS